jgi:hypothetical protein
LKVTFVFFLYKFSSKRQSLPLTVRDARKSAIAGLRVKAVLKNIYIYIYIYVNIYMQIKI